MTTRNRRPRAGGLLIALFSLVIPCAVGARPAASQEIKGPQFSVLRKVAFDQNLDAKLPLDVILRDEADRPVRLRDYFGKKPVLLVFAYYECPMLCTLTLNGLVRNLRVMSLTAGNEFEIVTVSIDPKETGKLASAKKKGYLSRYGRPGAEEGWHFLTGDAVPVRRLADVAGFKYEYDPRSGQYAHPAGVLIVTPEGRISRYIYGIDFPASNLRWALIEASNGKIGSAVDQILLTCFHYDPTTGRYNFAVMSVIRLLGVATVAGLAAFVALSSRRDRGAVAASAPSA